MLCCLITSKFMEMGGRVHFFLLSVCNSSISAEICDSFMPAIRLILNVKGFFCSNGTRLKHFTGAWKTYFHTMAFSEALYLALPFMHISWTPEVLSGVGIRTSIFWAKRDALKLDFITTLTSSFVLPTSRTKGITLKGREISFVVRYLRFGSKNN